MRFSPHSQLFYFNDRLEFCEFFEWKIKRINNADLFSQPPLLIFIKGANISGGHCKTLPDSCSSVLNKMECFSVPNYWTFHFSKCPKTCKKQCNLILQKTFPVSLGWQTVWFCGTFVGCKSLNALPDSQTHLPAFTLVGGREGGNKALGYQQIHVLWYGICWQAAAALTLLKTTANVIELFVPSHNNCFTTIEDGSTTEKTYNSYAITKYRPHNLIDLGSRGKLYSSAIALSKFIKFSKTSSEEIK